ncbi:MAG: RHS repeat-associated core domain-containing protein, partial [Paludibacteraceae bacterium]|nr:RHS repeat-associated core domain-containing protein [Paludibacteraceae bacterium]
DTRTDLLNNRGFTGHEHIDGMSLINMNGRVYDPLVGMFLSVDPFIQAPDNWLNYNRYMYCFGNPLSYTDPSGNIGVLATIGIGAAIGAVVSAAYGLAKGVGDGLTGWNLAKSTLVSAGIGAALGAVSAAASYAVSYLVSTGTFMGYFSAGAIMGTQWGAYGGFVYGSAVGAQGWDLIKYVAIGAGVGAVVGGVIGAGCYAANLVASRIYANNNNHCLTVRLENTGHVLNYKELYAYMKLDSGVKLDGASMSQVFSDSSEFSIVANELCYEDGCLKPITMDVGSLTMYGKFKLGLTYGCFTFGCGVVNTAGVFAYRALDQLLIK